MGRSAWQQHAVCTNGFCEAASGPAGRGPAGAAAAARLARRLPAGAAHAGFGHLRCAGSTVFSGARSCGGHGRKPWEGRPFVRNAAPEHDPGQDGGATAARVAIAALWPPGQLLGLPLCPRRRRPRHALPGGGGVAVVSRLGGQQWRRWLCMPARCCDRDRRRRIGVHFVRQCLPAAAAAPAAALHAHASMMLGIRSRALARVRAHASGARVAARIGRHAR
mmetsp:Transcript_110213/g.351272  ORF Transcript_110213/g.351272 Transcript_110213/m.351272 type:complete len:221 (-) Transcript_110213:1-663(-)